MAKGQKFKQSIEERPRRAFSEEFKLKKVREIEQKNDYYCSSESLI